MCFGRGHIFAYCHDWIEKSTLTCKAQEDSFSPRGHLDKPGQAYRLALTIFLRRAKKDQSGSATSFECGSTLVTCRRMSETHPCITEQDFARWIRVGRAFQVEKTSAKT